MQYAFGRNEHRVEAEDFDPSFHNASIAGASSGHIFKHLPWILSMMQSLPDSVTVRLSPGMASYVKMQGVSLDVFIVSKSLCPVAAFLYNHTRPIRTLS